MQHNPEFPESHLWVDNGCDKMKIWNCMWTINSCFCYWGLWKWKGYSWYDNMNLWLLLNLRTIVFHFCISFKKCLNMLVLLVIILSLVKRTEVETLFKEIFHQINLNVISVHNINFLKCFKKIQLIKLWKEDLTPCYFHSILFFFTI